MARPQRKNVDYFPHYISDGKKMFYIEQKYGNDGYASWFKILETLAKTDNHWVNLNEETEAMYLASKCRISEETLFNLLDDLSKLDQINSEMWDAKIIWSDKFIESIEDAYGKRSNNCQSLEGLRVHLRGLGLLKGDVKPQSKVKESKQYKSKEEKIDFPFDSDNFKNVWDEWKQYKKEQFNFTYKSASTEKAALTELLKITTDEITAIEVINQSIANGWKGFFDLKTKNNGKNRNDQFIDALSKTEQWKHI